MGCPGHQLCGLCASAVPASPRPPTAMPPVSNTPAMARLRVRLVFMSGRPLFLAAADGPLERILRPAGAESMGHLPHFVCRLPSGLWCAALDYADLVTRLLV